MRSVSPSGCSKKRRNMGSSMKGWDWRMSVTLSVEIFTTAGMAIAATSAGSRLGPSAARATGAASGRAAGPAESPLDVRAMPPTKPAVTSNRPRIKL